MSIFGKEVDTATEKLNKAKVRAKEFEGKGLTLQFLKVEKVKSQYGADEDATMVVKGILEEGEQFLFLFRDVEGEERKLWSTSMPFFISMQQLEINEQEWLHIRREGVKDKTRYFIEKVEKPANAITPKTDYPEEDIDSSLTPF